MGQATDGQLPADSLGYRADGVYAPGVGTVAAQAGTVSTDAQGTNYAPQIVQTASGSITALSATNTGLPVNLPAIVQKANATSTGSVASLAKAFASANTAGNSIVVVCGCGNGTAMTVADSAGNTYTQALNANNSTTFEAAIFYAVNIASNAANTVTVTNAGTAASMSVQLYEVSGLIAQVGAILGQTSSGTGTGTTASASNVAGHPNSLAFAGVAVGTAAQAVTASTGTNWTLDSSQNSGGTPAGLFTFGSLSLPLGNLGSVAAKATINSSEPWAYAVAVFKPVLIGVQGAVTIDGYNGTNITTSTTTLVKTGPGVLHAIVVNTAPASGGTLEIDDALTNTNSKGIVTSPGVGTLTYDMAFSTGLSITTATHAGDYTILWR